MPDMQPVLVALATLVLTLPITYLIRRIINWAYGFYDADAADDQVNTYLWVRDGVHLGPVRGVSVSPDGETIAPPCAGHLRG